MPTKQLSAELEDAEEHVFESVQLDEFIQTDYRDYPDRKWVKPLLLLSHRIRLTASVLSSLLQAGAGVNLADADGATALMWAEALGSASCAALLRKAGADTAARDYPGGAYLDRLCRVSRKRVRGRRIFK